MPVPTIWTWDGGAAVTVIIGLAVFAYRQSCRIGELKAFNEKRDEDMKSLLSKVEILDHQKKKAVDHVDGQKNETPKDKYNQIFNKLNQQIDHLVDRVAELEKPKPGASLEQISSDIDFYENH